MFKVLAQVSRWSSAAVSSKSSAVELKEKISSQILRNGNRQFHNTKSNNVLSLYVIIYAMFSSNIDHHHHAEPMRICQGPLRSTNARMKKSSNIVSPADTPTVE